MKTLYLSDLDGTLLDPFARLPSADAERINRLTAAGVMISFATARTIRSVTTILGAVDFHNPGCAPVALMNGTMIRDMRTGTYLSVERIPRESAERVLSVLDEAGAEPFVYTYSPENPVRGDPLFTSYRVLANETMRRFRDERVEQYGKPFGVFRQIGDLDGDVVYFCAMGGEELIRGAAEAVDGIPGTRRTWYPDAYLPGTWYLEIFPDTSSKKRAVEFLRARTGADRVVAFGDNRNDLPMFEAADVAVAVLTAADELKSAADELTDSVTAWIEADAGRNTSKPV